MGLGSVLAVSGIFGLGWLWQKDRGRAWEEPHWDRAQFVRLTEPRSAATRETVLWVVAVNPKCPHCRASLRHVATMRSRQHSHARLLALLVDSPRRPEPAALGHLDADEVWWDSRGAWRNQWGHRIYGEILIFASSGRHLRTLPPGPSETVNESPAAPLGPRSF
jgi:hypothetical protein